MRRNSLLSSPCLTGIVSPSILLPAELEDRGSLEQAFAHELAHLRRNDTLWNLIQRIALALFFFQPLLWRLVYRLETTAEEVCDDFVVQHCLDRTGYAQQLVELAESNLVAHSVAGVGMFKSKTMLGHRVVRILDTTRKLTTQVSGSVVGAIGLLTLSAAMLGGLIGNGSLESPAVDAGHEVTQQDSQEKNLVKVAGQILDPNGNPVAGAEIKVMARSPEMYSSQGLTGPYATVVSGSDGFFNVEFPQSSLLSVGGYEAEHNFALVARKPGFGLAWHNAEDLATVAGADSDFKPIEIKLPESKTPLRLKFVDTEGNPVPDVRVKIKLIQTFKDADLSPIFKAAKEKLHLRAGVVPFLKDMFMQCGLPDFKGNKKGEVLIEGLGDNRVVTLEITGSTICSTQQHHMTLDADMVSIDYGGMMSHKTVYHGAEETVTCESTQPIVGRVIDSITKKPLAGVKIFSSKFAGELMSGDHRLHTTTDDDGKFRLVGMPKGPGNDLAVVPNDQQPYFMMNHEVPEGVGYDPVETEILLTKGSWIRGKATDKNTGQPIVGARLYYLPFESNESAAKSGVYGDGQFMEIQDRYTTKSDGSFQLVGLPGKAVVGLEAVQSNYPVGVGLETIDKKEIDEDGKGRTYYRPVTPSKTWPTIMQQVVISDDSKEFKIDFELDSGVSLPLKVVSAGGRPLTGVLVDKLRSNNDYHFETTDSQVSAASFKPNEKRILHFRDKKKEIGRVVELDSAKFVDLKKKGPSRLNCFHLQLSEGV